MQTIKFFSKNERFLQHISFLLYSFVNISQLHLEDK